MDGHVLARSLGEFYSLARFYKSERASAVWTALLTTEGRYPAVPLSFNQSDLRWLLVSRLKLKAKTVNIPVYHGYSYSEFIISFT